VKESVVFEKEILQSNTSGLIKLYSDTMLVILLMILIFLNYLNLIFVMSVSQHWKNLLLWPIIIRVLIL